MVITAIESKLSQSPVSTHPEAWDRQYLDSIVSEVQSCSDDHLSVLHPSQKMFRQNVKQVLHNILRPLSDAVRKRKALLRSVTSSRAETHRNHCSKVRLLLFNLSMRACCGLLQSVICGRLLQIHLVLVICPLHSFVVQGSVLEYPLQTCPALLF